MVVPNAKPFAYYDEKRNTIIQDEILDVKNNSSERKYSTNPFNLGRCDAGFPQKHADIIAVSTTRTEISTDLDDCSVQQKFSFTSAGQSSKPFAMSFESDVARCPSTTGHRIAAVDVINTSGSYEIISQLTGPQDTCRDASSLLDMDEEDTESPPNCSSWSESMFIGRNDIRDTESRVNFYSDPDTTKNGVGTEAVREKLQRMQSSGSMFNTLDGALETESQFGFYKQKSLLVVNVKTETRDDCNVINDTEEPPSCREKFMSFADEEEDWLLQATMKMEAKKKDTKMRNVLECGEEGSGVIPNLRSFVSRCGSCLFPPV